MFNSRLVSELEESIKRYEQIVPDKTEQINRLKAKIDELEAIDNIRKKDIVRLNDYNEELSNQLRIQTAISEFLINDRITCDGTIEFAAIKSYRDGWKLMVLHGEDITPKKLSNVTIWANNGEAMQVETTTPNV